MGSNAKANEFLKECMSDALISLLSQKPFTKITADEIADAAGVHRSTWFRNFSSKSEAITYKLIRLWNRWADEHDMLIRDRYTVDNAFNFFQFNFEIRNLLELVYSAKLQSSLYDAFYKIMMPHLDVEAEERYSSKFFCYGLFGLLDEWIERGFCESPEEMTTLFQKIIVQSNL